MNEARGQNITRIEWYDIISFWIRKDFRETMDARQALELSNEQMRVDNVIDGIDFSVAEGKQFVEMGQNLIVLHKDRMHWKDIEQSKEFENEILEMNPSLYKKIQTAVKNKEDKTFVFRGISGSGKSKMLDHSLECFSKENESQAKIIEYALVIFKAFTSAQTPSSCSSTRTALKLGFSMSDGIISKCTLEYSLFDRIRVVRFPGSESNYHIFSILFSDLSQMEEWSELGQRCGFNVHSTRFRYMLATTSGHTQSTEHGLIPFESLLNNFKVMGWTEDDIENVIITLGIIVNLGNLVVVETDSSEKPFIDRQDTKGRNAADRVCDLMDISFELLEKTLLPPVDETTTRETRLKSVYTMIDSFAKDLYDLMLKDIVNRLNEKMKFSDSNVENMLNFVDMFGIDCDGARVMELEHLLVNFANEIIHNKHMIMFSELYGDDFKTVVQEDEQLLEILGHKKGILSSIDKHTKNRDHPHDLMKSLESRINSPLFQTSGKTSFFLIHSFGEESYSIQGMISDNIESLGITPEKSQNEYLHKLFSGFERNTDSECKRFIRQIRKQVEKKWLKGDVEYVNCIAVNPSGVLSILIDRPHIEVQLRSLSFDTLATCISRLFPRHIEDDTFYETFSYLLPELEPDDVSRNHKVLKMISSDVDPGDIINYLDSIRMKEECFNTLMNKYTLSVQKCSEKSLKSIIKTEKPNTWVSKSVQFPSIRRRTLLGKKKQRSTMFVDPNSDKNDDSTPVQVPKSNPNMFIVQTEDTGEPPKEHPLYCQMFSWLLSPFQTIQSLH